MSNRGPQLPGCPSFAEFWDTAVEGYGYIRHYEKHHPGERANVLLVFVHGILSSSRAWLELPWLMEQGNVRADFFSYGYPAFPGQKSSVQDAAEQLRTVLDHTLNVRDRYTHVAFVTHSTGGLVVKEMLSRDFERTWDRLCKASIPYDEIERDSLCLRTRDIFNFTVPHLGASHFLSLTLLPLATTVSLALSPLLFLADLATVGKYGIGHNHIASQLRLHHLCNRWVRELDERYRRWEAAFAEQDLPRPRSHDLHATDDVAIADNPLAEEDDRTALRSRGTHLSLRVPRDPNLPAVQSVLGYWSSYRNETEMALVHRTISRALTIDRQFRIPWISAQERAPEEPRGSTTGDLPLTDSQAQVHRELLHALSRTESRPYECLVTGNLGVGKSRVLRQLARSIAVRYLRRRDVASHLPVLLPLQVVPKHVIDAGNAETGAGLSELLLRYWCEWANSGAGYELVSYAWLQQRLRNYPTVLILDSVDEFLAHQPALGLEHIRRFLHHQADTPTRDSHSQVVILGLRTPQHGLTMLRDAVDAQFEVKRIEVTHAIRRYPALQRLMAQVRNPRVQALMQSLLMLNIIGPAAHEITPEEIQTFSGLHETALHHVLKQSGLLEGPGARPREQWVDALMVIAWRFFREQRGALELGEFRAKIDQDYENWTQHFHTTTSPTVEGESILSGFELIRDPGAFRQLLTRTVLLSEGVPEPRRIRFQHREWQDFLVARYLSYCIRAEKIDELRFLAFTQESFRTAGEYLREKTIRADLVRQVISLVGKPEHTYIVGNFCALIGNTQGRVEGSAVRELLEPLSIMPPIVRVVTITGLGYWTLAKPAGSPERLYALNFLPPALQELLSAENAERIDAVSRSLAWCHLRALELLRAGGDREVPAFPPPPEWPGLGVDRRQVEDALTLMCPLEKGWPQGDPNPFHRSFQEACIAIQEIVRFDEHRPISAVHYLFYISLAMGHGCVIPEVADELSRIFGELRQEYHNLYERYRLVPELLSIFNNCEAFHEGKHPLLRRPRGS